MKNQKNNPSNRKADTASSDRNDRDGAQNPENMEQQVDDREQNQNGEEQKTKQGIRAESNTDVRNADKGRMPGDTGEVEDNLNDMEMDLEDEDDATRR